tara:strand:+ start:1141 stop:2223 length:1083 start_codon:yes stop_codon:yes gene_type:complete
MILAYKKNIISVFLKNIFIISMFFFSLTLIMNILEEITFFKDIETSYILPLFLTLLNSFSVLFEIFPFIFLIGTMSFFMEILNKQELIIYKSYGLSNLNIITVIVSTTFAVGLFLILIFYNISSNLKFLYYDIKSNYTKDDKYLAVVTANGLWIKDQVEDNINIINAENIMAENLNNVLISQFDKKNNFIRLISSKKINIKDKTWIIKNPKITDQNLQTKKYEENTLFKTNFNSEIISTLFSNLSSLNLIKLKKLKRDYSKLGYSTTKIDSYQLKIYMYPIYLSIMVCIASILMLNIRYNKPRVFYLLAGILASVLVYYMNYLFNILIENQKIPFVFSVWFTQFILFLFCLIGLVRINEK